MQAGSVSDRARVHVSLELTESGLRLSVEFDDSEPESLTLFVGNIPYDVDDATLREHFDAAAAAVSLHRSSRRSRGFGFVTFASVIERSLALSGPPLPLRGATLTLQPAQKYTAVWKKPLRVRRAVVELSPGLVWLRGHFDPDEQRRLADVALGSDGPGFYRPSCAPSPHAAGSYGVEVGARLRAWLIRSFAPPPADSTGGELNLTMRTFGRHWDCRRGAYDSRRTDHDQLPVPPVPAAICEAVSRVLTEARRVAGDALPQMTPDICVANCYEAAGSLGLHQDRHESAASIAAGKPVVSLSFGDTALFEYLPDASVVGGKQLSTLPRKTVKLSSGDALVFGGASRLVFHGVHHIIKGSCTTRPWNSHGIAKGRLNLTLREY